MIELYHCTDARSFRALWALEELGLPYRLHVLPFPPRAHRPDYLALNPLGTIPLLIDGSRLRHLTRALASREWLCGGRFTMADLSVGYALLFAETLGLDRKFSPEITSYRDRLVSRRAFIAAKASQAGGNGQTNDQ